MRDRRCAVSGKRRASIQQALFHHTEAAGCPKNRRVSRLDNVRKDRRRASANTLQLTFYGPSMAWDKTYEAIKKWSEGVAVACPR